MEVAKGVHRFGSRFVNWYVVEDGRALTLVDAGLLGQWSQFTDAVERLGRRMADVEAIVLTHAHVDHTGFAERARTAASAAVHAHPADTGGGRARKLRTCRAGRAWSTPRSTPPGAVPCTWLARGCCSAATRW
jgi:glyoxylase-like metal-dependent hydrolase (beta-lactamase superfamily II)